MQIYHAQKTYFEKNKHWAANIDDLKLADMPGLPEHTTSLKLVPERL